MRQDASELVGGVRPVDCTTLQVLAGLRTADQLKMKFRTFLFTNHYTYSLPEVHVYYIPGMIMMGTSQPLFVSYRSRRGGSGIISIGHMVIMIAII